MKSRIILLSSILIITVLPKMFAQCGIYPSSGQITIATNNAIINAYHPGIGSPSAGNNVVTVGSADPRGYGVSLSAGDVILIIQMQGADIADAPGNNNLSYGSGNVSGNGSGYLNNAGLVAGNYEYNVIQSISTTGAMSTIHFNYPLVNSYYSRSIVSGTLQTYQVIWIPKFYDLLIGTGYSVTAPSWNGSTGGVVALNAANTMTINGSINASGKGFRGGGGKQLTGATGFSTSDHRWYSPGTVSANTTGGSKGEGIAGTPYYIYTQGSSLTGTSGSEGYVNGSMGRGAPANAGGGATDGTPSTNGYNTGGGGGAGGGKGGNGGSGWHGGTGNVNSFPYGGHGGTPLLLTGLNRVVMGGGGGAGSANNSIVSNEYMSSGGSGGGIILLMAKNYAGNGSVNANGGDAPGVLAGGANTDAAGGGGGGGTVVVVSTQTSPSTGLDLILLNSLGGKGGDMANYFDHGPGGGGGGGVIITHSNIGSASVLGGTNGVTRAGSVSGPLTNTFGATPGTSGVLQIVEPGIGLGNPAVANSPCGILPVAITSFSAVRKREDILLSWTTANALNFSHFELEHSTDGILFKPLHQVNYVTSIDKYEFLHTGGPGGNNYYRLKLVDTDRNYVYSKIIMVHLMTSLAEELSVYPQPANKRVEINIIAQQSQKTFLSFYNLVGVEVKTQTIKLEKGKNIVVLTDLTNLSPGMYVIRTAVDRRTLSHKIIIAR